MKNYELTLVLPQELQGDALNKTIQDIISFIQDKGGLIEKQEMRSRQKKGTLSTLFFAVKEEEIESISKKVKEIKEIQRSMLLVVPRRKAQTPRVQIVRPALRIQAQEEPKMSTADIDKKLEEIFK